jgi:hypothetical protein
VHDALLVQRREPRQELDRERPHPRLGQRAARALRLLDELREVAALGKCSNGAGTEKQRRGKRTATARRSRVGDSTRQRKWVDRRGIRRGSKILNARAGLREVAAAAELHHDAQLLPRVEEGLHEAHDVRVAHRREQADLVHRVAHLRLGQLRDVHDLHRVGRAVGLAHDLEDGGAAASYARAQRCELTNLRQEGGERGAAEARWTPTHLVSAGLGGGRAMSTEAELEITCRRSGRVVDASARSRWSLRTAAYAGGTARPKLCSQRGTARPKLCSQRGSGAAGGVGGRATRRRVEPSRGDGAFTSK